MQGAIFCPRVGAVTGLEGDFCNGDVVQKGDGVKPEGDIYDVIYVRPCPMREGCIERFATADIRPRFPIQIAYEPVVGA